MPPNDEENRAALRDVLVRSGLSMRALAAALGRDPGYVAALLDPSRPSRARPTPVDLLSASDATGITFVELLESLWGIERARLAGELGSMAQGSLEPLTDAERTSVADFVSFLSARHTPRGRRRVIPSRHS